jgi:hypothetical protein
LDLYARFADIYAEWSAPMTEDVPFYTELTREANDHESRELVWVARKPA